MTLSWWAQHISIHWTI